MKIAFSSLLFFYFIFTHWFNNVYSSRSNHSYKQNSLNNEREVLIVSTLNGNLHGIDVKDGKFLWSITNSPLVSQSLSNLEFFKDGKKFRLIPSLEGQLYMLEVDSINKGLHALPITADALFTSSFQLSSDSLLVGGKEQHVVGFNPISGEIKYQCGKDGCHQGPPLRSEKETCELLLCRRISHVVRAVDIDSGHEKWNFSVGQDEILTANNALYPRSPTGGSVEESVVSRGGCVMSSEEETLDDGAIQWSFNVERGTVQAASPSPFSVVHWHKELGASLSRVWLLRGRSVKPLSIFARDANSYVQHASDESGCPLRRSLFLGVYEGHLYVQLEDGSARQSPRPTYVALPSTEAPDTPIGAVVVTGRHRVSKVTRYAPPSVIQGFFRPSMAHDEAHVAKKWYSFQEDTNCYPYASDPLVVTSGSFIFQKAVLVALMVVVGHLIFKKVYLPYQIAKMQRHCTQSSTATTPPHTAVATHTHTSRYETDYDHIRCLGRGAFGVVFEARHRVDQYHYAVKRVRVRYSAQARDRLLQEVQAFAHLEHPGIVRYYQAWFEMPPDGWQEQRDRAMALAGNDDHDDSASHASTTSFTRDHEDTTDNDWSINSVGHRSLDPARVDGDSLLIFDRSVSVGPSKEAHPRCMWACQGSVTSVDVSGDGCTADGDVRGGSDGYVRGGTDRGDTDDASAPQTIQCSHIYLFISMHLYSGTTLHHRLLHGPRPAPEAQLAIFAQIVEAVAYLHHNGLMHRDLKPSNILFDTQDHIRIVDFGLATPLVRTKSVMTSTGTPKDRTHTHMHTSNVGTQLYMSPEQQHASQYDQKVDIFALGIIFLELVLPLDTAMERAIVLTDARRLKFSDALRGRHAPHIDFASQLLHHDPRMRPTCDEILAHHILTNVTCDGRSMSKVRTLSSDM